MRNETRYICDHAGKKGCEPQCQDRIPHLWGWDCASGPCFAAADNSIIFELVCDVPTTSTKGMAAMGRVEAGGGK